MQYREVWEDVPNRGARAEYARWCRARKWRGLGMIFSRSEAVRAAVDETTHERLLALSQRVEALEDSIVARLQPRVDAAWAAGAKKLDVWPTDTTAGEMRHLHELLKAAGDPRDGDAWVALDRAAARLLSRLRAQAKDVRGGIPRLLSRPAPAIATLRLRAGLLYDRPVKVKDVETTLDHLCSDCPPIVATSSKARCDECPRREGAEAWWIDVPAFGICRVEGAPANVERCAYVDAALLRQSWRLRFVFTEETDGKGLK